MPGIRTGMHNGSGQAFKEKGRNFSRDKAYALWRRSTCGGIHGLNATILGFARRIVLDASPDDAHEVPDPAVSSTNPNNARAH